MHLDGTHTLNAPRQQVWNMLLDPEVLARVVPGVKTLEPEGDGVYKAISEVKMGPVSGSFSGQMEVADQNPPERFTLKMKQNSKIGNVDAEGNISLKPLGASQTEVTFAGDAKLSGTLARMGQRVLSGVAKSMTKQFFQSLEKELENIQKTQGSGEVKEDIEAESATEAQTTTPAQPADGDENKDGGNKFIRWLRQLFGIKASS